MSESLQDGIDMRTEAIEKLRGREFGNKEYDDGVRALFSERDAFEERYQVAADRIVALEKEVNYLKSIIREAHKRSLDKREGFDPRMRLTEVGNMLGAQLIRGEQ